MDIFHCNHIKLEHLFTKSFVISTTLRILLCIALNYKGKIISRKNLGCFNFVPYITKLFYKSRINKSSSFNFKD